MAYTVPSLVSMTDTAATDIYTAPVAGGEPVRLTSSKKTETLIFITPRILADTLLD